MKSYSIEYDRRAEKQLRAIRDLRLAIALQTAIEALVENPRAGVFEDGRARG